MARDRSSSGDGSHPERLPRRIGAPVTDPTPETSRAYASDWAHFAAWCRRRALAILPADADTLLAYLLELAPRLGRGTLGRRRSAIAAMHRGGGHAVPVLDKSGLAALRRATGPREKGEGSVRPQPMVLVRMAMAAPRDLAGMRDRAMLLLLAALLENPEPIPRTALLALDAEHVRFTAAGAELWLPARSDMPDPTLRLALARSPTPAACLVRALEDWLRISNTAYGPIFRKVDRWGGVEHARLGPDAWRRVLARHGHRPGSRHG